MSTSTSVCPSCGAEYSAGVAECPECLVLLVHQAGEGDETVASSAARAGSAAAGLPDDDGPVAPTRGSAARRAASSDEVAEASHELHDEPDERGGDAGDDDELDRLEASEGSVGEGGGDAELVGLDDDLVAASDEQVAYELDEYDPTIRRMISATLTDRAIPHVWEATTLIVRPDHEDAVDIIIDEIDEGSRAARPMLDPDADQVVYDVADWSDEQRDQLIARLEAAGIAYEWDENDDLAVLAADEDEVEAIFDAIEFPDALAVEGGSRVGGDDDLVTQDVLSELFVAADRLAHDPRDHEGVLALVDAARLAEGLPLPFGFSPPTWKDLIDRAATLRKSLEEDEEDDEIILEQARTLRTVVRQFT